MTAVTTTSTAAGPGHIWSRTRGPLLALLVLLCTGIGLAAIHSDDHHGRLDPRSADPQGSRAVAKLLQERGVSVRVTTTLDETVAAAAPDATLFITTPDLLTGTGQRTLRSTASTTGRTVLLAPEQSVPALAPGVHTHTARPVTALAPRCALPAARNAEDAETGGVRYTADNSDATACYPSAGLPTLLLLPEHDGGETVLIGSPDLLYNNRLGHQGNASLALQLLGSRPHLVWYLPSLADSSVTDGDADRTFIELIPSGWLWGALQLAVAAGLAALWRARRLGPLVTEELPVVIRASESTEGRARLYRKANARDRAAAELRSATRTRIAPFVGVSPIDAHTPAVLLPAVSVRPRRGDGDLHALLFGPAPANDVALVLLADQLDTLEREVRTS
ncbi:DUF4350 domain-containing protein [Streptomyces sp. DT171]|uniref:DUF4350 domain-containing protein n=1 Tax=Streptomyces sp. DT171 TaxID=3416524 RepID=UPI003CECAB17